MYKKILLPLDGSALAEKAILHASEIARKFDSRIHLLRCMMLPEATMVGMDVVLPQQYAEVQDVEKKHVEGYLERISHSPELEGLVDRFEVPFGAPGEAILEYAEVEQCDLIVMCSHGRTGFGRFVYGSVAEKVMHHAPCPLLILRVSES